MRCAGTCTNLLARLRLCVGPADQIFRCCEHSAQRNNVDGPRLAPWCWSWMSTKSTGLRGVPKSWHGYLLQSAANNFAKGNVQKESALMSNWLTTGLDTATLRIGWFLLSPTKQPTYMDSQQLRQHYDNGYPEIQQDDRPYQKG